MGNKKYTAWQRLNIAFGEYGTMGQKPNTYKFDKKEILKTTSKAEFEKKKLEKQQSKYLEGNWQKIESNLYTQAIYYEPTRLAAFYDFESMEFTPEISAALDIFAEESTTANEEGDILSVYSESSRIKSVLDDLFSNRLDISTNLPMWVRNTPIRDNSIIPLLDGTYITIKELSEKIKSGEEVWTYSIQHETNEIKPGKIVWCDLTRKNSNLVRTTLDNGTHLDTTPDHEYMLRDGSYVKAENLNEGDSLMPFYTTISNEGDRIKGYEKVYNPNSNRYQYTHRMVAKDCVTNQELVNDSSFKKYRSISNSKKKILNHKVYKVEFLEEKSDVYCMEVNGPNGEKDRHNFPVCSVDEEGNYSRDGVFLSNCKYGDNFVYLKLDQDKGVIDVQQLPNIEINRKEKGMHLSPDRNTSNAENKALKFVWKEKDLEFNSWEVAHFRLLGDDRRLPYGTSILEKSRRVWKQLCLAEDAMLVYRTSRAPERRIFKVFVGNMDDGDVESYVQRQANKFKKDQIADNDTGNVDLRYNQMAVDQDFFIPVRDPNAPSPIDTLPGASNLGEIQDIMYIQKKLLTSLRVPKAFLGFEETTGEGKNLSLQDVRFARTINRIQKSMIQELNKIAIIHLYLLGFEDELTNFTLHLTDPSSQSKMLKLEEWSKRLEIYGTAVTDPGNGIQPMSTSMAKKKILGFSEQETNLDLQQQRIEKAVAGELGRTTEVIVKTGVFDDLDKIYGDRVYRDRKVDPEDEKESDDVFDDSFETADAFGDSVIRKPKDNQIIISEDEIKGIKVIDLNGGKNSINEINRHIKNILK